MGGWVLRSGVNYFFGGGQVIAIQISGFSALLGCIG